MRGLRALCGSAVLAWVLGACTRGQGPADAGTAVDAGSVADAGAARAAAAGPKPTRLRLNAWFSLGSTWGEAPEGKVIQQLLVEKELYPPKKMLAIASNGKTAPAEVRAVDSIPWRECAGENLVVGEILVPEAFEERFVAAVMADAKVPPPPAIPAAVKQGAEEIAKDRAVKRGARRIAIGPKGGTSRGFIAAIDVPGSGTTEPIEGLKVPTRDRYLAEFDESGIWLGVTPVEGDESGEPPVAMGVIDLGGDDSTVIFVGQCQTRVYRANGTLLTASLNRCCD